MPDMKGKATVGNADGGTAVKERVCSECKGPMVQRKSKFGQFWGCGNYPKCKHIDKN